MKNLYARRSIDPRNQYRRWIDPRVRTLRVAEITAYLEQRGWKELPADRPGYRAFQEPGGEVVDGRPLCQFVPDTEETDLPLRLFELLTGLSEVEDRQASDVIDDILRLTAERKGNGLASGSQYDTGVGN
jgi:hypothetical protein